MYPHFCDPRLGNGTPDPKAGGRPRLFRHGRVPGAPSSRRALARKFRFPTLNRFAPDEPGTLVDT